MTIGWHYWVEIENIEGGHKMYKFHDDYDEPLQSMVERFIPIEIKKNDVIQTNPNIEGCGGCLCQVTDVSYWGVTVLLKIPYRGDTFMRVHNGDFELVGDAPFNLKED
jgi:hypothetical protein